MASVISVLPSTLTAAAGLPWVSGFLGFAEETDIGQLPVTPLQAQPGKLWRCQIQQSAECENDRCGCCDSQALASVRLSLGRQTTAAEIDAIVQGLPPLLASVLDSAAAVP